MYISVGGVQYRVYYEQTGPGIPILMQHTAGTNGLQWRHVLSDPEYKKTFQLIAYDLPFHGKHSHRPGSSGRPRRTNR
jgi:pimeloyl-ACP methyl ester carboxylesterase